MHMACLALSCVRVCVCVRWLIHVWHYSFMRNLTPSHVTWLIHVRHDSFMHVPGLIRVWHDSFICDITRPYATWLMHMWHDSFMWDMTRLCMCPGSFVCAYMGWLRFVGSLKLWVSLAEYCLFYRALLQKRPILLRSLWIGATPYAGMASRDAILDSTCNVSYMCVYYRALCATVWLWFLKSYVSFVKEPYKRDDILHKRPLILRSLLIVATPYPPRAL